jgi:hypothetical protein
VDRARAVKSTFAITTATAVPLMRLCARLEGIPLAIELAASRVKVLSIEQIADRLDDPLNLLTGGSRTALPRHQTLLAAIDWSYNLLTEPERILFRRLSVFAGGWTLEAAERVCGGDGVDERSVLELLSGLVDKSLVLPEDRIRFWHCRGPRSSAARTDPCGGPPVRTVPTATVGRDDWSSVIALSPAARRCAIGDRSAPPPLTLRWHG